jgi:MFS family permease
MFMDISSEMIHALLPLYLVTVLGASTLTVGIIEGIAEATTSIVKVFSGALSDRLGKRKLLAVLGYGLAALTRPIFPLASSIGWLVAARFIDRLAKGIRGAPRDALVADLAPPELRGASFGLRQTLDTIGAFLGPLIAIGLMLLTANHFTFVFWIAIIPAVLSVAVLVVFVREPDRMRDFKAVRAPLSRAELARLGRAFWLVVAVATIFTLARFSEAFLILRAQGAGFSMALAPAVLVVMNIAYALSSWPAGALSDKVGRTPILVVGLVMLALADLVLAFGADILAICIGVALWGLHMGLTQGLFASMIADTAPIELRGTAFGMFNLITGVVTLVASVVAGALWDVASPTATFLAGASFTALALVAVGLARHRISGAPSGTRE